MTTGKRVANVLTVALVAVGIVGSAVMPVQAELVGHWTFDESPIATSETVDDSSGSANEHDGTLTTSLSDAAVAGNSGGAFQFASADDDYVSLDLGTDYVSGANQLTFTFWINPDTVVGAQNFLFSWGVSSGGANIRLSMEPDSNGGYKFYQRHQAGAPVWEVPEGDPDLTVDGGWYQVAVVVPVGATTVSSVQVYLNGKIMNNTVTDTEDLIVPVSPTVLYIGGNFGGANGFEGQIDDVQFYNTALSDADILWLYNNPGLALGSVSMAPIPSFTATPTNGVDSLQVVFTDTTSGGPTSWEWDFENDGGAPDSILQNPTNVFGVGTYSVKLTASNALGTNSVTNVNYIVVSAGTAPTASFTATPTNGPDPMTVVFTDTSTDFPTSWAWDFENDGSVDSTVQSPTNVFAEGTYSVKLTVSNAHGSDSVTNVSYIVVTEYEPPVAEIELIAGLDTDADDRWENLSAAAVPTLVECLLDTANGVTRVTGVSAYGGITAAYDMPGDGLGTNGAVFIDPTTAATTDFETLGWDTTPVTLEIWFKPDSLIDDKINGQILFETAGTSGLGIRLNDDTVVCTIDAGRSPVSSDISSLADEFIQAVLTYDTAGGPDNMKLYINGALADSSTDADTDWSAGDDAGLGTRGGSHTGGLGNGDVNTESFNGMIAIFRGYKKVLSEPEILANYRAVTYNPPTGTLIFFR